MRLPDEQPTPAEYAVIVAVISGTFVVLGTVGLFFALRAQPEKHDLALALKHYSVRSIGIGMGVAVIAWLVRKSTN